MKTQNQNDGILKFLKSGKSITAIDALTKFRCFRLAARIHDLREKGHDIAKETIVKNGQHYAVYSLVQK